MTRRRVVHQIKEEYVIQFYSHGDRHQLEIDLECLAKALLPYIKRCLAKRKK